MDLPLPFPVTSKFLYIFLSLWLLGLCGCALQSRQEIAHDIAAKGQLQPVVFHTATFAIQGYQRFSNGHEPLTVYLEGDGAAWKNRTTLTSDPTPKMPTGLALAAVDHGANILYLARPCQYISSPSCAPRYWSSHRYSLEIITALSQAIDQASPSHPPPTLTLVGYSGGGVIAALLAARRQDVQHLITIAANMDIDHWTKLHGVSPLWGSENPSQYADKLQDIRQTHISGAEDHIVPIEVLHSYLDQLANKQNITILVIPQASHHADWQERWPSLRQKILPAKPGLKVSTE